MAALLTTRQGEYAVLDVVLPGHPPEPAGLLLYDPSENRLDFRLRRDWDEIADAGDAEVLELLENDLRQKSREMEPETLLAWLEETLSNILRVSPREPVLLGNFEATLNRLYARLVPSTVRRFVTHLPLYSCRAAAGRFGENMEVEEEGWVEAPAGLRLTSDMFVSTVTGRSMEPVIPDGSRCVFRAGVAGSRQGKLVLVENFAEPAEGGQRYTVKRYRSEKAATEDGWRHTRIFIEPLNPEFEPWEIDPADEGRVRVFAEFVAVLD